MARQAAAVQEESKKKGGAATTSCRCVRSARRCPRLGLRLLLRLARGEGTRGAGVGVGPRTAVWAASLAPVPGTSACALAVRHARPVLWARHDGIRAARLGRAWQWAAKGRGAPGPGPQGPPCAEAVGVEARLRSSAQRSAAWPARATPRLLFSLLRALAPHLPSRPPPKRHAPPRPPANSRPAQVRLVPRAAHQEVRLAHPERRGRRARPQPRRDGAQRPEAAHLRHHQRARRFLLLLLLVVWLVLGFGFGLFWGLVHSAGRVAGGNDVANGSSRERRAACGEACAALPRARALTTARTPAPCAAPRPRLAGARGHRPDREEVQEQHPVEHQGHGPDHLGRAQR